MRLRRPLAYVVATCACAAVVLGACGSSNGRTVVTPSTAVSPTTVEASPAGDIPDNQAFVKYTAPNHVYALEVPEGWARTGAGTKSTFSDHFNSIRIDATKRASAPTEANARASDVPTIQRTTSGFMLGTVSTVTRTAGPAVLVKYRVESDADPVTGKRIVLDVERYEFWRNGTSATLTLSAPQGSDNVDPWKRITNSFTWSQ